MEYNDAASSNATEKREDDMPRINEANLEEHRRHTMNALLDSAETIMREQGGEALTPANVSRGAGIARNSIYRYVKDMKDLRRQLMARHMPQWVAALEKGLGGVTDPAEIIVQWVKINLEQSILQGHDWMTQIPLSDAETYRDDKDLWQGRDDDGRKAENNENPETKPGPSTKSKSADSDDNPDTSDNNTENKADEKATSATDIFCGHSIQTSGTPSLEPNQPSLHQRVNAPMTAAWKQLRSTRPQVGIALTEGLVTSGMRLLNGKEHQGEKTQTATIRDIIQSTRAIVEQLRDDK
ncbi:TetR/AcrR family transcriptional regulator [Bifidobacterium sp. ESL0764]|uniref:TetR/AcrR family transcriptional regulator n=1 Tax=Bifidobacterium sp. ESL0764 TaxID=2983228 RepID=UPI0023F7FF4D|nr:TetR/AcrR family transcriptional regulator [Bifidobacterium sp. ESL0764]WEV65910.1 TetR/AcrR family transcriptional regulator [Bifidobacterium sp. ESL0764]